MTKRHTTIALVTTSLSLFAGCAESKPATVAPATPAGVAMTQAPPPRSPIAPPTSGTVAISDEIRRACGIPQDQAYFAFDSTTILSSDIAPLDAVAKCFTDGPLKGRAMRLIGHADPRGSSDYNMTLGQSRADAVQRYLDRHGLGRAQMATTSRGALDATGTDESSWAHDRRVEVVLGG